MMPENKFIKTDLESAQKHIKPTNTTWIFTDSGFAPRLREENFSLFLPSIGLVHFTWSEPYFNYDFYMPKNSQILANIDTMFMTEYKEYHINEVLRNYTSTISKSALQSTMYNSHSDKAPFLAILSTIYAVSSSDVDVRTWATLPKHIYVQRIDTNKTNLNDLNLNDTITNELKSGGNNLIYIRRTNKITDEKIIKLK